MNTTVLNIIRFILLLFSQVLLFNRFDSFGYIDPLPYILFILLYPVNGNKNLLLISSFLLGLLLDMFCNSGGIHALASLVLAFIRPSMFRFSFGLSYEYQTVKIADKISTERITFILLSIFIHHLLLFTFELFSIELVFDIIKRTLITTLYTFVFCLLIIYLIKPSKR
ncbi:MULTISPECIES: rod shape-determining protein MreD [Flavobacterium]|uniref:Rod shape-determining protein MreD n=1 Tax=Flavobacterium jumunjinense TaxID=998845 RepID=A0ABV5GKV1_9FLAO|nr:MULTISPECIES: rod shape-determining protein MreD [Flavobacterium]